jgi:O-succinylbenzoate synthase
MARVRVEAVELLRLRLPFLRPFRTARGVERERHALLVHLLTDSADGWGECAAPRTSGYTEEHIGGAHEVIRELLAGRLLTAGALDEHGALSAMADVDGNRMAKAAVEMAVLDASLRASGESLAHHLGATRPSVGCGVVVGIAPGLSDLLDEVERRAAEGYRRVKLKVAPGWDVEPVAAVRRRYGTLLPLAVDANQAYSVSDLDSVERIDTEGLLMIEEPLAGASLPLLAELARRLRTPICLDESIPSADAAREALERSACSVVNIKPARVGGVVEAVRVHDTCRQLGAVAWCGGMFETGIGRAANLALAALPGFTMPADMSPSGRHYGLELTEPPAVMSDGCIAVPSGPGLGVTVDRSRISAVTVTAEVIRR